MITTSINTIVDEYKWEYLQVKPLPFEELDLDKEYFEDKTIILFGKYIGPPCSGSGEQSECYFGKLKNEGVYFYTMDGHGYSGYDCCGNINLYYAESPEAIKRNMKFKREAYIEIEDDSSSESGDE